MPQIRIAANSEPLGKTRWIMHDITTVVDGKGAMLSYGNHLLQSTAYSVVSSKIQLPYNKMNYTPHAMRITDFNGISDTYEVESVENSFDKGFTRSANIGQGKLSLAKALATQKRYQDLSDRSSKKAERSIIREFRRDNEPNDEDTTNDG